MMSDGILIKAAIDLYEALCVGSGEVVELAGLGVCCGEECQ